MFKRAGLSLNQRLRNVHTHASSAYGNAFQGPVRRRNGAVLAIASVIATSSLAWYSASNPIQNDAMVASEKEKARYVPLNKPSNPDTIYSLVWGSNNNRTLCPNVSGDDMIRSPAVAQWLDGVALRDLQFEEKHAACIDARGDVYQWGDGFFGKTLKGVHTPKLTLKGLDIVQIQLMEHKLYALSKSGKVYVLSTDAMQQELRAGAPTPTSDSWWSTGWFWGEEELVDFAEVTPSEPLAWRESVVSIAGGKNHLLALTSKGRVFAHPVNKQANHYGQLGFRKFSIPDPAATITKKNSHLHVDLVPKSLADPYMTNSRSVRVSSTAAKGDNLANIDDQSIRFCTNFFEVPALRGVQVAQVAAGARSSFVRTPTGRVLGWGANGHGQIGLGANVALDTITVPTEVILWRFVGNDVKSKCIDVTAGGDLTGFLVERSPDKGPHSIDLLMCGNGQYGALGNNLYTNVQGNPLRVKSLSGLVQYNERTQSVEPINPDEVVISPTGHVLLTLDSSAASAGVGGQDLMIWGKNHEFQLGNGKRSNVVVPAHVPDPEGPERLMLVSKKAKEVKDLHGKIWKRGVKVKQQVGAGYGNSVVYWKIEA